MAARKKPDSAAKPRRTSTQKYIRNLYGTPLGIKLASGERMDLLPRGMRGDLMAISKDQEKDHRLIANVGLTVEVIPESEARQVIEGQATNQQSFHPALALLRDPQGRPYEQEDVRMDTDPQNQGEVVAQVDGAGNIAMENVPGKGQRMVRQPGSVGPKVATDVTGGDPEMGELLRADEAAKNGTSLTDVLGGFNVER